MLAVANPIAVDAGNGRSAIKNFRVLRSSRPGFDISVIGLSADGRIAVGDVWLGDHYEPFVWSAETGVRPLGLPSHLTTAAHAKSISADGLTIEGYFLERRNEFEGSPERMIAFRWTEKGGFERTGTCDASIGDRRACMDADVAQPAVCDDGVRALVEAGLRPAAVSARGATIVGEAPLPAGSAAFVWRADDGMRMMSELVASAMGADAHAGWSFWSAAAVSGDGRIVAGSGQDDRGGYFGYVLEFEAGDSCAAAQR